MNLENKYLQIEGIVDKSILNSIVDLSRYTKENTFWLFVDYSPTYFKKNTVFDVVLSGEDKQLVPNFFHIKLLNVLDQFGNFLEEIPQGWKTICRFEFKDNIPSQFKELPKLKSWKFNKNSLKIARHDEIVVDELIANKLIYTKVIEDFVSIGLNTASVDITHLKKLILQIVKGNPGIADILSTQSVIETLKEHKVKH